MEAKKIWYNKKIFGGIVVLWCFSVLFFFYRADAKQMQQDLYGVFYIDNYVQTEREHIASFHKDVEETLEQADSMGAISIFVQEDSFSAKNLEKTKIDYEKLLEVEPEFIENMSLHEFFVEGSVHIFVLMSMALVAYCLLDEDKQGLRAMIFATVNGRGSAIWNKIAALFLWAGILVCMFYGAQLLATVWYYDGDISEYWNVPMQSLSIFRDVPLQLQMGQFLLLYGFVRWFVLFFFGVAVWGILFWVNHMVIGVGTLGGLGLVSLVIYYLIDENNTWNILKFCNPWYWIMGNEFFMGYRNLDIFSQAVNKRTVGFAWVCSSLILVAAMSFFIGIKRYPCEPIKSKWVRWGTRVIQYCKNWKASWMAGLGLTGMEYYKLLISQKGILILLVVAFVFVRQTDFSQIYFSTDQEMYFSFVERNAGVPSEVSERELAEVRALLDAVDKDYQAKELLHEAGELSTNEWIAVCIMYDSYFPERTFLSQMEGQTAYLEKLKAEQGIEGWYVNLYGYNKLLSEESIYIKVLLYFAVILLSAGLVSVEKKNGMLPLIRGSACGEKMIFRKKLHVVWTISLLLYTILSGLEFIMVESLYGLGAWGAPVQSIMALSDVPIRCSIGVYFILLFLIRGIGIVALASVSCWVSRNRKRGRK